MNASEAERPGAVETPVAAGIPASVQRLLHESGWTRFFPVLTDDMVAEWEIREGAG